MAVMDTEEKIRLAIQVAVAIVLWTMGIYQLALLATIVLVPWKPFYEASVWLIEPVIKWRVSKSLASVEAASEPSYVDVSAGLARLEHYDA